jgi:hypothetical protein
VILFRWGEKPCPGSESYSAIGRALEIRRDGICVLHELRSRETGEWLERNDALMGISLARKSEGDLPAPGIYHQWYDGPHCCLWLGRLAVHWSGHPKTGHCRKCEDSVGMHDR